MHWQEKNDTVAVPIDEWFYFEFFWKRSTGEDGRVWAAVNGEVLWDHRGQNKKNKNVDRWYTFKVYTGEETFEKGYKVYHWIDDFELWSDFPYIR